MPRDGDVHTYFGFDPGLVCLPINSVLEPPFERKVIEEEKGYVIYQDEYGVTKKMNKATPSRPQYLRWPAQDRQGFEALKQRLVPSLKDRVPQVEGVDQRVCPSGSSPDARRLPLRVLRCCDS
jgi:hypothetical protein